MKALSIYKVNTEHSRWGKNFGGEKVAAYTCEQAIQKAKRNFQRGERVESVERTRDSRVGVGPESRP